jgi:DNA-binding CsgD family transcriptional regulator
MIRSAMGELDRAGLSSGLVGRERERAAIGRLLGDARCGGSGSLVVRGEPGIGKSALLDDAAQRADGMLVLRTAGVDAESDLAFAGLYGLVRPIVGKLYQLVETHSRALAGALGLAPSPDPDRFLVSAAVLSLLAAAAEAGPVLCLVDDAQWLDLPSADALVFTARRLRADRLAMLFAARDGEARRFEAAGLPELVLAGVDERCAAQILDASAHEAVPGVRARLLAEAAGNPLALRELPTGLTAGQLRGLQPLPEVIPLTPRLLSMFRRRIASLSGPTRIALLIAAADGTGDLATVLRAAAGLELPAGAFDPAEGSGLIRTGDGTIKFLHPLARSALYEAAPLSQRQRVHRALASALPGEEHADRRVWHQAVAALTADEAIAAALEASALRAQRRAGHASAATAFQRAADLSPDESRRAGRLASAARAACDAGQPDRAGELIGRVLPHADGSLCARMLHLRGVIEARSGHMAEAVATLTEAADISTDPSLIIEMLAEAAQAAVEAGDPATAVALGARVREVWADSRRAEFTRAVVMGFASMFAAEYQQARVVFDDALKMAGELDDDPRAQIWAADAASTRFDQGAGLPFATRAVNLARRQGLLSVLPAALEQQSMELFWNSSFDLAYAAAEEGYRLSLDLGLGRDSHLAMMACVEAVWGREAAAREHADRVAALGRRTAGTYLITIMRAALGLLELAAGRPDQAADTLLDITAVELPEVNPLIAVVSVPDAVEANVRAGRPAEKLEAPLARFRAWVRQVPTDGRCSLLARCEALLAKRPPDQAFAEAARLAHGLPPFQRARTELLYGEWLRRDRKRIEARAHLRAAAGLFRTLGAVPWAERAEAELRATGETARRREPSALDGLTPQELQIAGLAAQGLTNREIAAHLFLSPRTVEYHLGKVFTKLRIASRTELIRYGLPARGG